MAVDGKISLNNRTLGMSSDEYVGGSFLYGENINHRDSSKSFKLSNRLVETRINKRSNGKHIAQVPINDEEILLISKDGYIESNYRYNQYHTDRNFGGPLIFPAEVWKNAILVGNDLIVIRGNTIDRYELDLDNYDTGFGLFDTSTNYISNTRLESDTSWTVGTGWTTGDGAIHTSGTDMLSQNMTLAGVTTQYRVFIKMSGCTTGSCNVSWGGTLFKTLTVDDNGRSVFNVGDDAATNTLSFTPTDDFDGTILTVNVNPYDSTKIHETSISITDSNEHPVLLNDAFLYVGCGATLEQIDITTRTVNQTLNIIDSTYNIVDLGELGTSILIFSNNGYESKSYYRDGNTNGVQETVDWRGKKIERSYNDGNMIYTYVTKGDKKYIYIPDGYDKNLISSNLYDGISLGQNKEAYRENQRFDFNPENTNCLTVYENKFAIPGYYGIYTYGLNRPFMKNSWVKEFLVPTSTIYSLSNGHMGLSASYVDSEGYNVIGIETEGLYQDNGWLVTNPILWDDFSTEKALSKNKIGYICPKDGQINIYVNADDYFFWVFDISTPTKTPTEGTIYQDDIGNKYEVIEYSDGKLKTKISYITKPRKTHNGTLTKVSGTGDSSISYTDYSNFILVKSITEDEFKYGEDLLFGKDFIDTYMPYWHKVKIGFKLSTTDTEVTPEVFNVGVLADIVNKDD